MNTEIELGPVVNIKKCALQSLLKSIIRYKWRRETDNIVDGITRMLIHYGDEELVPVPSEHYKQLLFADKRVG